jgi:hypothetical protein
VNKVVNVVNQINTHRHARYMGPPPAYAKLISPPCFTLDNPVYQAWRSAFRDTVPKTSGFWT